jgi:hypothetical protein
MLSVSSQMLVVAFRLSLIVEFKNCSPAKRQ